MHGSLAKRWPVLCLIALLSAFAQTLHAQTDTTVPDATTMHLLQSGAAAIHQNKPAEAEGFFRQAVAAAPQLPDAYLGLGMAELREGKADDAIAALTQSLALNPRIKGAHLFLGIAQYQTNQLNAAIASLRQEIEVQPQNTEALTWLGIAELGAGNPDEAVGPLDRAAALNPKDPNILDYRGRAHALVAQESYRALTALDPDSWRVHRALGEIDAESMQYENAVSEYKKAIEKQPNDPDLYEALGDAYQHLSRLDDATHAYQMQLNLNPRNAIALYNLGRIQVLSGDAARGVTLLRQALEAHAPAAPADYYLGLGLFQTGETEEAATRLEKTLTEEPSDFIRQAAYYQLLRVYKTLHREQDAQRAAEELKRLKANAATTGSGTGPVP